MTGTSWLLLLGLNGHCLNHKNKATDTGVYTVRVEADFLVLQVYDNIHKCTLDDQMVRK
jgi:hypothetical protein